MLLSRLIRLRSRHALLLVSPPLRRRRTLQHSARQQTHTSPSFYGAVGSACAVIAALAYHVYQRYDEPLHHEHTQNKTAHEDQHQDHDSNTLNTGIAPTSGNAEEDKTPLVTTPSSNSNSNSNSGSGSDSNAPGSFKYVIVGGGTAAYNAAVAIQDIEPGAEILMISESAHPPYRRSVLSKPWMKDIDLNIAIETAADEETEKLGLFYRRREDYEIWDNDAQQQQPPLTPSGSGLKLMLNSRAMALDPNAKKVTLANGRSLHYDKLLIATGYKPETPVDVTQLSAHARRRVLAYNYLEDKQDLDAFIEAAKSRSGGARAARVAILGSELLATELAVALAARPGVETTQLTHCDARVLTGLLPSALSAWLTQKVAGTGVIIKPRSTCSSKNNAPTKITESVADADADADAEASASATSSSTTNAPPLLRVEDLDGEFDVVIVEGRPVPEVNLAANGRVLELDPASGAIAVTQDLLARGDIYAAGAAASYYDAALGKRRHSPSYEAAATQGFVAGRNMARAAAASAAAAAAAASSTAYTYQPAARFEGAGVTYDAVGIVGTSDGVTARAVCAKPSPASATEGAAGAQPAAGPRRCSIFYADANTNKIIGVAGINVPQSEDGVAQFLKLSRRMVRSSIDVSEAAELAKMHRLFDAASPESENTADAEKK